MPIGLLDTKQSNSLDQVKRMCRHRGCELWGLVVLLRHWDTPWGWQLGVAEITLEKCPEHHTIIHLF